MPTEPKLFGLRRWLQGEQPRPRKFSDIWRIFLIALAQRATQSLDEEKRPVTKKRSSPYFYDLSLIAEEEDIFVSQQDLQRIASFLEQHGWISVGSRAPVRVNILQAGIDEANSILDDTIGTTVRTMAAWLEPNEGQEANPQDSVIPATDRFVRLDDNSQQYSQAVAHLEELICAANEIRINDWPEKDGVVASLSSALNMIKSKYVNRQAVLAAVSGAAAFIILKFAEAPISELANRTWDAVKALF